MSELMREFLTAWLEWAEAGAPSHDTFRAEYGLCGNSNSFDGDTYCLEYELAAMFKADGLDGGYPFGESAY